MGVRTCKSRSDIAQALIEWVQALTNNVLHCPDRHSQMGALERTAKFNLHKSDHLGPPIFIIAVHLAGNSRLNEIIHPLLYKNIDKWISQGNTLSQVRSAQEEPGCNPITPHSFLRMVPSRPRPPVEAPWISFATPQSVLIRITRWDRLVKECFQVRAGRKYRLLSIWQTHMVTPSVMKSSFIRIWLPKKKTCFFHTTSCIDLKSTMERSF